MTLRIPKLAEEAMLDLILAEGYTLKLFTNDVEAGLTPAQIEALTAGSFTEATFTGYAAKTLTGGSWVTTALDGPSTGEYAQQTFTRTLTGTAQAVRGYYIIRTTGGALRWHEYFPGPLTVTNNGDAIVVTPTFTLDDDTEAEVAARGAIARQTLTASSATWSTTSTTDHTLASVPVDVTRLYAVKLHTNYIITGSGRWLVEFFVGGVLTDRLDDLDFTATHNGEIDAAILWEPATGTPTVDVRVTEVSGTATLGFAAAATATRRFWVEDIGPR